MKGRSVSLLLVEDHVIVRAGILSMLRSIGFQDIEEAGSVAEARAVLERVNQLDLVLLDLNLPDSSSLMAVDNLQKIDPALPIMLITAEDGADIMQQAFKRGVLGFLPKTASPPVMLAAIELVLSGGKYIPEEMLPNLMHQFGESESRPVPIQEGLGYDGNHISGNLAGLTPRQKEVADHLLKGRSNKEIARIMGISPGTVKIHISAILHVLNVESRTKAVWLMNKEND